MPHETILGGTVLCGRDKYAQPQYASVEIRPEGIKGYLADRTSPVFVWPPEPEQHASDSEKAKACVHEAMCNAGISLSVRAVCWGLEALIKGYGEAFTLAGAIDFTRRVEESAAIMRTQLEKATNSEEPIRERANER